MRAGATGTRPCLYLVATTGHPNYGDELVCSRWLRHLARTAPDADVWVDCHSPGLSQLLLGDLHPRVRFVDTLWRMCWAAPDDPAAAAEFVAGAVRRAGTVAAMDAGRPLLLRADVLHVVGGGYLNTVWPRHYGLLAGIVFVQSQAQPAARRRDPRSADQALRHQPLAHRGCRAWRRATAQARQSGSRGKPPRAADQHRARPLTAASVRTRRHARTILAAKKNQQ